MDDYSVASLTESKNEWCARLVNVMTPAIVAGLNSIFEEAWNICEQEEEEEQYLKTFQTFLSRVPKWNPEIIEGERKRICEVSSCSYLEDLITCVHIIQLKALTCIRVGQDQKKVDIQVPSVDSFVHKVYINVARKVYTNVYLFEKDIAPLQIQKHNRELEIIIKECVLNSIRESMPVEEILRSYLAETTEEDVVTTEEIIEKPAPEPIKEVATADAGKDDSNSSKSDKTSSNDNSSDKGEQIEEPVITVDTSSPQSVVEASTPVAPVPLQETTPSVAPERISFTDTDKAVDINGIEESVNAPKTAERLERIAAEAAKKRKEEEEADDESDEGTLSIGDQVKLEIAEIQTLDKGPVKVNAPPELQVETLI